MNYLVLIIFILSIKGCTHLDETALYIDNLENENNISYKHVNNYGSYIPPMCYTKLKEKHKVYNACYSCHTRGKHPNFINDTILQKEYSFPKKMMKNPYLNLFKDKSKKALLLSDDAILTYVNKSNYFDDNRLIILRKNLPKKWFGYKPDCYFNFDSNGFDRDTENKYTLWRAFRYYPFLGTFWPTNGSTDDVMIRLDKNFSLDKNKKFNINIYTINLAIVEANIKQKEIPINLVDETNYGVDLDGDGKIAQARKIFYSSSFKISYVGYAKELLAKKKIHLVSGLFPLNTEFLHSVRYLTLKNNHVTSAKRMKELRYTKKTYWKNYAQLKQLADEELRESTMNQSRYPQLKVYRGDFKKGFDNNLGWIYQGFIEDRQGVLRPQTNEETLSCMGCHSAIGATTDTIFSFARKFEGVNERNNNFGWNHWSQKDLKGVKDRKLSYKIDGVKTKNILEYTFYLKQSMGNEFRDNQEINKKFFNKDNIPIDSEINKIKDDVSYLLMPSKQRALELDKAYKTIVEEQSFINGRDSNMKPIKTAYKDVNSSSTGVKRIITQSLQ